MAIETIIIQGEDLDLTQTPDGSISVARTQSSDQERSGVNADGTDNGVSDTNTGLPEFDQYGLRPDYSGDGYLDINGNPQDKAFFTVDPADLPAGDYLLTIRGATSSDRALQVEVNGVAQGEPQTFNTSEFYQWELVTYQITVPETTDPIQFTLEQTTAAGPNVDAIAIHDLGTDVTFFAPEITSAATFDTDDSGTAVGQIEVSEIADTTTSPDPVIFSLTNNDGGLFQIDDAGNLSFTSQPSFDENDASANAYAVTVEVTDGTFTATQDVTVNVSAAPVTPGVDPVTPDIDPVILPAEDAVIADGATTLLRAQDQNPETILTDKDSFGLWPGYSGTGYIDFNGDGGGVTGAEAFALSVTVAEAGLYDLHVRMMNAAENRPLDIAVNGVVQHTGAEFSGTGFGDWLVRAPLAIDLQSGVNEITLAIPQGFSNGPNIDAVAITGAGDPAPTFPASNTAPAFDVPPSDVEVDENTLPVADFAVADDGQGDVTFSLSGEDQALFEISETGALSFIAAPDFEANGSAAGTSTYAVSVTVADEAGSDTAALTVTVTDTDETPPSVTLTPIAVAENDPGADVATIVVTDADTVYSAAGLTLTDPSGLFEVVETATPNTFTLKLLDTAALDFEADAQPALTVSAGGVSSESFSPAPADDTSDNAAANAAPTAANGTATIAEDTPGVIDVADLIADDSDADADLIVTAEAANGTVSVDGTQITFTPDAGFAGDALITYRAEDRKGLVSADATIAVTVTAEDDAASAIDLTPVTVAENDAGAVVATVTITDPDSVYEAADLTLNDASGLFVLADDGDDIVVRLKDGSALDFEAAEQPQISVSLGDLTSGALTLAPADVDEAVDEGPTVLSFNGAITGYSFQDKPATGSATPVDSGAGLTLDGNLWKRVDLGQTVEIVEGSVMTVDIAIGAQEPELVLIGFDTDNDPFDGNNGGVYRLAGTQGPSSGFVDLQGTGTVQQDGTIRFEIDLANLVGQSFSSMVIAADDDNSRDGYGSVTFSNVSVSSGTDEPGDNQAPVIVGGGIADISVDEGGAVEIDMAFVDPDDDALTLTFEVLDGDDTPVSVPGLTLEGNVLAGPVPATPGIYTVNVTADDGNGGVATDSFVLNVVNVNDAPVAEDVAFEPFFGTVGQPIDAIDISQFTFAFSDPDGDALDYVVAGLPDGLSVNAEGVITGTPTDAGTGSFTIVARDPDGAESAPVTIGLLIDSPQVNDVFVIEAEDFTGLPEAENFFVTAQPGASGNQLIRVNPGESASVTTDLSQNGISPGWYQVALDVYDETDGTATFSLQIGDTLLADNATFDALGTFTGSGSRGGAGQSGNIKTISFPQAVFIDGTTILTLSGQADGELLRTDKLTLMRVESPNEAPGTITLDATPILENADGAVAGTLSATDPDGDDAAITYSVDAASPFEIDGDQLKLKTGETLDFEAGATVTVDVTATDAGNAATTTTLTIAVTDVDEAPEGITIDNATVAENAAGAVIGTLGAFDPEGGALTFSVIDGRFVVEGATLRLADGVSLDSEQAESVTVDVTVSDGANSTTETLEIAVTDGNDAPELATPEALADVTVDLATESRTDLTPLGASDPDGDPLTFGLRSGTADALPAGIAIDGTDLVVGDTVAAGTYVVEIFAFDGTLESESVLLNVTVGDALPFAETIQLEARDGSVTILDTDRPSTDPANSDMTQVRDAQNPEPDETGKVNGLWPDFNGTGYLDMGGDVGDAFSFDVTVPEDGDYTFAFRYNNGSTFNGGVRPMTVAVNDTVQATPDFASNGDWTIWQTETVTLALTGGTSTVTLANTVANGPNFDQVEIAVASDMSADADEFPLDLDGPAVEVPAQQTASIDFIVTGVDSDVATVEISFDGGVTRTDVTADLSAEGEFSVDASSLAAGAQTATIIVTDLAGNEASDTFDFVIEAADPVAFDPVTIQAEDATIIDVAGTGTGNEIVALTGTQSDAFGNILGTDRTGYEGAGYVDYGNTIGDTLAFTVTVPADGVYTATFRYANGDAKDRPLDLVINGQTTAQVAFEPTRGTDGGWNAWTDVIVDLTLTEGENTIALTIPTVADGGVNNGPNIDQVTFAQKDGDTAGPAEAQRFEDVVKINFEAPLSGNGNFNAPAGYTTPAGFESDTGEAYGDRGNGFSYGWVDVNDATGEITDTPLAQPTGSARYKNSVQEASDLQKTYLHFDYPGAPAGDRERAWEIEVENGTYELTISIGDTAGQYDSNYVLNVEGEQFGNDFIPVNLNGEQVVGSAYSDTQDGEGFRSTVYTGVVQVTDGRLTIDGTDGHNVEVQWLDLQKIPDLTPDDNRSADLDYSKFVAAVAASTQDGQVSIEIGETGELPTGINPLSDIVVGVQLQTAENSGPDVAFTDGIRLVETITGQDVAINVQVSGGGDSVTIKPLGDLKEETSYTLVMEDVLDLGSIVDPDAPKRQFQDYTTTFVTGKTPEVVARDVAFTDQVVLDATASGAYGADGGGFGFTSVEFGPDGKLYVATIGGEIKRWDVNSDGTLDLSTAETLSLDYFNDRSIIGLAFDPEDASTIWVTDNANVPRAGKAFDTEEFSGQLTKITLGEGGGFGDAEATTYLTGLPRSGGDHVTNSIEFRQNPDAHIDGAPDYLLYFTQGSNSAAGAPDNGWGFRPERLLSASVLEVDHTRDVSGGPFDVQTEPYDPATDSPTFRTDRPFNDDGTFDGFYDPFAEDAVLKIYGEGIRNAYDLVWHSNGNLYAPTNGTARGGNTLDNPDTDVNEALTGLDKQYDYLFQVQEGGYYGHPNELLDNYVVNGGANGVDNVYTGDAGDNAANTSDGGTEYAGDVVADADYDADGVYSLGFNKSPNGATEYTGDAFGANLQGAILFAQFSQGDNVRYVLVDPATGWVTFDDVLRRPDGNEINEYIDPLDIIENPLTGQLYLMTLNRGNGGSQLILLNPAPGGTATDTTADENNDLRLIVIDATDPANTLFEVAGLDSDIILISVAFDGGAPSGVTLDGDNRFTADTGATGRTVTAVLTVSDGTNTASDTTIVALGNIGDVTVIDAIDFTLLDTDDETIARRIDDPSTHEDDSVDDANGDGLNDGYDGSGYVDLNGGAEDKASFTYVADTTGTYELTFRLAAVGDRSILVRTGDQSVAIDGNTGSFTNWEDRTITLTLEAGVNTVVIEQTTSEGPNIDSVTVTPLDVVDTTADEGGDLDIVAGDLGDQSRAEFVISGADADITSLSVVFSDGTETVTATPSGNGAFTVDLSALSGDATATLTVSDGTNTATDTAIFTLDATVPNDGTEDVGGQTFVIYEAENATLDGAVVVSEDRSQSGDFVDFNGSTDQSISWTISAAQAGDYAVDILYALSTGKTARPMILSVDGTVIDTLPFSPNSNATETEWGPQGFELTLSEGIHTITVTAPNANGPNVDYLRITQSPLAEPLDLSADEGQALALTIIDQSRSDAVVLEISGLDDDIETATISFNGGPAQSIDPVNGQVTLDSGVTLGQVTAVLTVVDDATNTASAATEFSVAPDGNPDADIAVRSLDAAFLPDRLHFSYLENNTAVTTERDFKDTATVRIENTGTADLEFLGSEITGPFDLQDETVFDTLVLAPGQTIDVTVVFDNTEIQPKPSNGQNGVQNGALTLITNDAEDPFVTVDLAGFWQSRDEGGQEPNVNEVWDVFGFGNEIAGLALDGGGENSALNFFDLYIPEDETEVLSPYWRIADGASEARITQIAAFHGPSGAAMGIHGPGDKSGGNDLSFGSHEATDNQTILPTRGNGEFFTQTFDNGTIPDTWQGENIFGIEIAGLSTDPTLNPTGGDTPTQAELDAKHPGEGYTVNAAGEVFDGEGNQVPYGYTVRMFQALDSDGNPIENTYLGVMDYTGINYDYNDNMFVIEGVTPVFNGADLVVSGLDDAAADDRLVFTNIEIPIGGQEFRDEATITLSNPGFAAVPIDALTLGGADAGEFEIVGPVPGSIPAGGSVDVTIVFDGVDGVDDGAAVLKNASLTISSPGGSQTIALAGLAQLQSERGEEPSVAQIVEAFGYTTDVAQSQLANGGRVETVGDEVLLPYLQRLDSSKPIEVINLAAFLQQTNISRVSTHDPSSDELNELFAGDDNQGQTVLPDGLVVGPGDTGSVGRASIDSDDAFGIKVTVDGRPTFAAWSDPEINKADDALGVRDGGHYIRFFQAKGSDGHVIEGTYIGIQDYPGGGNFDYNDAMFLVTNVQGYDLTAAEDANQNGVNDALETDSDTDGIVDFFDDETNVGEQAPFGGSAPVLGDSLTVSADTFDTGGQGVAWNDDPGKAGGDAARTDTDVEIFEGALAFVESGEWVEYTIDVTEAGLYDLSTVAKSPTSGATITVSLEDGLVLATITVPDSNGAGDDGFDGTSFGATDPVRIALEAGAQTLRFTFGGTVATNGYLLDLQSFTLDAVEVVQPDEQTPFPGPDAPAFVDGVLNVQAADYDDGGQGVAYNDAPGLSGGTDGGRTGSDVEITDTGDVGWIEDGEWLEYTIDVPAAGDYAADLVMAFGGDQSDRTATIDVYRPGEDTPYATSGPVANPNSGGWTSYATRDAGDLTLEEGPQILRITFNGGSQDIRSFSLTRPDPVVDDPDPIGEAGSVTFTQTGPDQWFQVQFTEALTDAAVVMGPISETDDSPATMRVRNVTDQGFEFQLDEWDYLDGVHGEETVSWIALESGTHTINGLTVAAGTGPAQGTKSDISFDSAFDGTPVVMAQVSSVNDDAAVADRVQTVRAGGFTVGFDRDEAVEKIAEGTHPTESLSWIAFETGGSVDGGLLVGSTGDVVTHGDADIDFGSAFSSDSFAFIADMQTEDGNDPSVVRLALQTATSATVFVEEEASNDTETRHTTEEVGYAALEFGTLFDDLA